MTAEATQESESDPSGLIGAIFALGWSCSEERLLVKLPEIFGRWLRAAQVSVVVTDRKGTKMHEAEYSVLDGAEEVAATDRPVFERERALGRHLRWKISIRAGSSRGFARSDGRNLEYVLELVHNALECLLVKEKDSAALNSPFNLLSEREWQACRSLEGFESEKQIAELLGFSRHTLHTYVKCAYRKTKTQSRLEIVHRLQEARGRLRQGAVERFLTTGGADLDWAGIESDRSLEHRVAPQYGKN